MNTEQETNTRVEESELNLGDILQTVLANWYWFVLSVVVCAGATFLYLKWAPKVYTRTASVLIKDDAKGGAMSRPLSRIWGFSVRSGMWITRCWYSSPDG